MKNPIKLIRERYREWRDQRFLRRHHCENWEQYNRWYDPDIVRRASDITNWYQGYAYVHCIESYQHHYAYRLIYDYGPGGVRYGADEIDDWCRANCQGKFRSESHRVSWNQWSQRWHMDEMGGSDLVFFAFKDEQDYLLFSLRWS
jgi:hypothetical protein